MPRPPVEPVQGIPRWFTYAMHLWFRRECRRRGEHAGIFTCQRCGLIIRRIQ